MNWFASVLLALMISGCSSTPTVTTYRLDPDGRVTKLGTVTRDEDFKQTVAERIDKEMSGVPPSPDMTWAYYWSNWYSGIRSNPKAAWKSPEFKTSEDFVTYIKNERMKRGLPTYDSAPAAASTERVLGPGDCVVLVVAENGSIKHCVIDADGNIGAPLGVTFQVAGKTLRQVEELIEDFYAQSNTIGRRTDLALERCGPDSPRGRNFHSTARGPK